MRKQLLHSGENTLSQTYLLNTIKKNITRKNQYAVQHAHNFQSYCQEHGVNVKNKYFNAEIDFYKVQNIKDYSPNLIYEKVNKPRVECNFDRIYHLNAGHRQDQQIAKTQLKYKQKRRKDNGQFQNINRGKYCQNTEDPTLKISEQLTPQQIKILLQDSYLISQKQNIMNNDCKSHKHAKSSAFLQQPNKYGNHYNFQQIMSQRLLEKSLQACVKKQQLLMKKKLFNPYKYFSRSLQGNISINDTNNRNFQFHNNQKPQKNYNQVKKCSHKRWPSIQEGISVPESARMHSRQLQSMFKADSQNEQTIHQQIERENQTKQFVTDKSVQKCQILQNKSQKQKDKLLNNCQQNQQTEIKSTKLEEKVQESLKVSIRKNSSNQRILMPQDFNTTSKFKKSSISMTKASSLQKQYEMPNISQKSIKSNSCSQKNSLANSIVKLSIYNTQRKQQKKQDYQSLTTKNSLQLMKVKSSYIPQTRQSPKRHVKQNKQNYYKVKLNQINQMQKTRLKLKITRKK